jgi:hypothetical protein
MYFDYHLILLLSYRLLSFIIRCHEEIYSLQNIAVVVVEWKKTMDVGKEDEGWKMMHDEYMTRVTKGIEEWDRGNDRTVNGNLTKNH